MDNNELERIKNQNSKYNKTKTLNNFKDKSSLNNEKHLKLKENNKKNQNENDNISSNNSDIDDSEDSTNYNSLKNNKDNRSHRNIGLIASDLLSKAKQKILYKKEREFLEEEAEHKKLLQKKTKKYIQRKKGYCNNEKDWHNEKRNLIISTKGVVKLFNIVLDIKKKVLDEVKEEESKKELKSRNFLLTHDLIQPPTKFKKKNFKEDNENNEN